MDEEQLKSPEFLQWLLDRRLKIKENISIPWEELKDAEPYRDPLNNPGFRDSIARIIKARNNGEEPPGEDLQVIRDMTSSKNPLLKFVHSYNWRRDESDAGEEWAEYVLTELTHAEVLEDLHAFTIGDWFICAKLLQSDIPVPRRIIGELLENLLADLEKIKADIPALGIKNLDADDHLVRLNVGDN